MSISPYARKAVTSVLLASLALSLTPIIANAAPTNNDPSTPVVPSSSTLPTGEQRYIVKYKGHVNAEAKSQELRKKGVKVKDTLTRSLKASVVVASSIEIESLKKSADVESVEFDVPVSVFGTTSLWGLDRIDQRTGRDGQYSIGDEGAGVNVYVADTGLNLSHTEFSGRVPTAWNGINDGNGVNDCNGHGTHVAGTVAGTTYGVAKKSNIIPMRILECDGTGWSSTAIASIDWAISHHVTGQPAVMNLSIGGFTSTSFDTALQNAINDGITVVAAAGNSNQDACTASPARVPAAITVAATDVNDAQASFSNYGSCVDLNAPGVSIKSAYKDSSTASATMSGTSMATPHVAGAAAVMLSRTPSLTPAQVHQSVVNNATADVLTALKGSTPNKMLFITAPASIISYAGHVQNIGWQAPVSNGQTAGTVGQGLRLEALRFSTAGQTARAHVQNIGWQNYSTGATTIGTSGQSLRVEAVQVHSTVVGQSIRCQAHVEGIGWMPEVGDGEVCGTVGRSLRLEAVRFRVVSS